MPQDSAQVIIPENNNLLHLSEIPAELLPFLVPMIAQGCTFKKVELFVAPEVQRVEQPVHDPEENMDSEDSEEEESDGDYQEKEEVVEVAPVKKEEKISTPFECSICVEPFTKSGDYAPRILSCGHTFCTTCVGKMFQNSEIRCSSCRTITFILRTNPLDQVQLNQELIKIVKNKEEKLRCYNCNHPYRSDIAHRNPRILPRCGHSECEQCLKRKIRDCCLIDCTECQKSTWMRKNWKEHAVKNYNIMDILKS